MLKLFMGLIGAAFLFLQGKAQDDRYAEWGGALGASIYQGDISPYAFGSLKRPGMGVQLFHQFNLNSAFSMRLNYALAFLSESDKNYSFTYKPYRNFSFETRVNEFAAHLVFNPLRNNGQEDFNRIVPYVFTGLGFAFVNITRDWKDFQYSFPHWQKWVLPGLAADSMHALPNYVLTLPVGVGLRYPLEENISLFAEVAQRFTQEEYLDGFSQSANRKKKDGFATVTIGVIFRRFRDYTSRPIRYY